MCPRCLRCCSVCVCVLSLRAAGSTLTPLEVLIPVQSIGERGVMSSKGGGRGEREEVGEGERGGGGATTRAAAAAEARESEEEAVRKRDADRMMHEITN